jgi:hypothetical protein
MTRLELLEQREQEILDRMLMYGANASLHRQLEDVQAELDALESEET